jgi:hypothetical protein
MPGTNDESMSIIDHVMDIAAAFWIMFLAIGLTLFSSYLL